MTTERVFAPGRVNLIGEHTDHCGGLALPMAVQMGTTIEFVRGGDTVELWSDAEPVPARVPINVADPAASTPDWARLVAGVVAEVRPSVGLRGTVTTELPIGGGLASSAALEVALAVALGGPNDSAELARLCRRAEHRGTGVPCGLMDQLTAVAGVRGHALLIDFQREMWVPEALPENLQVHVVPSGVYRRLDSSPYAQRLSECAAAARIIGPLRAASERDVDAIADDAARRRARHVVTENERVRSMVDTLRAGDLQAAGALLAASHASLREDFEVSLPVLDDLVAAVGAVDGVYGARLTGAGFGGCLVAFSDPGVSLERFGGWPVFPSDGALLRRVRAGS